ncbi:MAG TPA: competence/damage-inducible protein A [Bacteroidia bacterium]|nr:competence/damage-inducible protein A [Bacteroidia bacterium]
MNALIINIGDELLIGQIVNINASYIAKQLNLQGIKVNKILVIQDNENEILKALEEGQKYDVVIITGGLGPTKDDITKHTLCKFFEDTLIESEIVLNDIKNLLAKRNREMNDLNKQQALVLSKCKIIRNYLGTAPGMILKKNNSTYVAMPGVPFEMKPMLKEFLLTLKNENQNQIIHKTVFVFGIPESELALKIENWENDLQKDGIKLAYLPNRNLIRLRLSSYSHQPDIENKLNQYIHQLKEILGNHFVGEESFEDTSEHPLASIVVSKLKEKKYTISFAESCTGGSISAELTRISGASEVFKGSIISYSNEVKMNQLNVQKETLNNFGAVSKVCVEEMVSGVQKLLNTDIALAVSGIAGPTGGTPDKPVGTVWMALYFDNHIETKLFQFGNQSRDYIIESAVFNALAWILKKLVNL